MARPRKSPTIPDEPLRELARSLGFYALVDDWGTYREQPWLEQLLRKEETERQPLRLYRLLPDTPHRFHHGDRVIVDQLFDQDLPLTVLQAALLLGSARRACRDPRLPKLQPI